MFIDASSQLGPGPRSPIRFAGNHTAQKKAQKEARHQKVYESLLYIRNAFSHSQSDDSAAPLFDDNSPDLTARIDSLSPEKQNVKPKKIFARYLHGFDSETPALDYWRMNLNEASQIPGFGTKKQDAMHPPVINTRLDAYTASLKHSTQH